MGPNQIEDAREATKHTPYIKLKFKDDFETISKTLNYLISNNIGELISLDANASWSVETTMKVIEYIS